MRFGIHDVYRAHGMRFVRRREWRAREEPHTPFLEARQIGQFRVLGNIFDHQDIVRQFYLTAKPPVL